MSGWTFDERFKAWADSEGMTLITPNNMLAVATSKDMEAAFLGGINSRNAEVQALREALKELRWAVKEVLIPGVNALPKEKGILLEWPVSLRMHKAFEDTDTAIARAEGGAE